MHRRGPVQVVSVCGVEGGRFQIGRRGDGIIGHQEFGRKGFFLSGKQVLRGHMDDAPCIQGFVCCQRLGLYRRVLTYQSGNVGLLIGTKAVEEPHQCGARAKQDSDRPPQRRFPACRQQRGKGRALLAKPSLFPQRKPMGATVMQQEAQRPKRNELQMKRMPKGKLEHRVAAEVQHKEDAEEHHPQRAHPCQQERRREKDKPASGE